MNWFKSDKVKITKDEHKELERKSRMLELAISQIVELNKRNEYLDKRVIYLRNELEWEKFRKPQPTSQFSQEQIDKLIRLCHPDKHYNSKNATEITQLLLSMRK